jgi:hypothetical protein
MIRSPLPREHPARGAAGPRPGRRPGLAAAVAAAALALAAVALMAGPKCLITLYQCITCARSPHPAADLATCSLVLSFVSI